jgi:hypothetical protein
MPGFTFKEDPLADAVYVEDEAERLVALQAVETYRALRAAVKAAPHGRGLAAVEAVVRGRGFDHLAEMYQGAVGEHPAAQKRGPAVCPAPAAGPPRSAGPRPSAWSRRSGR